MQQQLLISRQVLAYHDPELAVHLSTIGMLTFFHARTRHLISIVTFISLVYVEIQN